MSTLDHLIATFAGAPALPGARCRGRHHLFDPAATGEDPDAVEQRHTKALGLCEHCPSLRPCRDWLQSLPRQKKPDGVIAGQIRIANRRGRLREITITDSEFLRIGFVDFNNYLRRVFFQS